MIKNKLKKKLVELLKSFDDSEADSYEDNADLIMDLLESTISQTKQELIEEVKKAKPVKKGSWVMHFDWISKSKLLEKLSNK